MCELTVTDQSPLQNHLYRRHDTLREHMSGLYHTPKVKFARWVEIDHQSRNGSAEKYFCPYCPDESPNFTTLKNVLSHIEKSTSGSTSSQHDDQKRNDGWYDLDWAETPGDTVNKKRRKKRQANDQRKFQHRTGFTYSGRRALEQAIPDPDNEYIVLGGPTPAPSAKMLKYTEDCDLKDAFVATARSEKFLEECDLWDPETTYISQAAAHYFEEDERFKPR